MTLPRLYSQLIPCVLAITPLSAASAQSTPIVVVGEGLLAADGELTNQASPFTFKTRFNAAASYCCSVYVDNTTTVINSFVEPLSGSNDFTLRGDVAPPIAADAGTNTGARGCLITSATGNYAVTMHFGGTNGTDTANNLRVQCEESTLFGGYNTSAAAINFLEITNTTLETDFTVQLTIGNEFAGGAEFRDTFTVGGHRRLDIPLHDMVQPGAFGKVTIAYDGPVGALTAAVSQYRLVSTSPLDFVPVGRIVFDHRRH